MIDVGGLSPQWVLHVVLGGIKKQEEQTRGNKPFSNILHLCFPSWLILTWALKDETNPFLSKMLLVRVFITRSRLEPMFTIHWVFSHPLYYDIVDTFLLFFFLFEIESHTAQTGFELPVWAEDDLELLTVLSLLQKAGITGGLHRAWLHYRELN